MAGYKIIKTVYGVIDGRFTVMLNNNDNFFKIYGTTHFTVLKC